MWPQFRLPRFSSHDEPQFQTSYYFRVRPTLRFVSLSLAATLSLYLILGLWQPAPFISLFSTPYLAFCVGVFALSYWPSFERHWQSITVALGWLAAAAMLFWLGRTLSAAPPGMDGRTFSIVSHLFFVVQTSVLMVGLATLRLTFRPALLLQCGVVAAGLGIALWVLPPDGNAVNTCARFLEPVFLVLLAVLLAAWVQEQLARRSFEANRQLAVLQSLEHEKRVESEKTLHILNSAIGGIVHDLGNPLTSVQSGAELVDRLLRDEQQDLETLLEVNDMVQRGAKMLNFLRLSLIEQSRVLEGKPVPVELRPVSIRAIVEAGVSFQKARFAYGHSLSLEEGDCPICADEMKMVTVLMNLIGNALKYSDGQVRVVWHPHGELLYIAVLDEGTQKRGLSEEQASRLFVPFGRLETHADIEGTGLGLLSVQKIIEAHGGQVWIEGFEDGTPDSSRFSTRPQNDLSMLSSPSRTAFVLTCPLPSRGFGREDPFPQRELARLGRESPIIDPELPLVERESALLGREDPRLERGSAILGQ